MEIKKYIASDAANIAKSNLDTAKANLEIKKLSGQDTRQQTVVPESSQATAVKAAPSANYQVIYVGKSRGRWTAMINDSGKYYQAAVGTILPDGSSVTDINRNGVEVRRGDHSKFLVIPNTLTD